MPAWVAPAIAAVGSIVSGMLSRGGSGGDWRQTQAANQSHQLQADMATHGIRWRVHDAKAAGLHPLAALGAPSFSYSPAHVSGSPPPDYSWMRGAGQDIGRAIAAGLDKDARRLAAAQLKIAEAQADKSELEVSNERIRQLNLLNQGYPSPHPSGAFIPSQGDEWKGYGDVDVKATMRGAGEYLGYGPGIAPGNPELEVFVPDKDGYYVARLSEQVSESLESDYFAAFGYGLSNLWRSVEGAYRDWNSNNLTAKKHRDVLKSYRRALPPLKPGWEYRYNPIKRGFKPYKIGKGKFGSRFYEHGNIRIRNDNSIVPGLYNPDGGTYKY